MNIEEIKKVLAKAPELATHMDGTTYLRYDGKSWLWWRDDKKQWAVVRMTTIGWAQALGYSHSSLSDLRKIVELTERAEKAERERDIAVTAMLWPDEVGEKTMEELTTMRDKFALQQKVEGFKYGFKRVLYMMALEKDSLGKGLDVHIAEESDKYASQLRKQLEQGE